mgnify:CR=1 FL=1|jgi:hypothetical protein
MIKTLALAASLTLASAQHVPPHRIPSTPVTPISPAPAPPPKPTPTPAGNSNYKVSDITHEQGFGVDEITMLPAQKGAAWAPNRVATVTVTGSTDNDIEAGTVKWQLYQDGVTQFIASGNRPYYTCDNKGCSKDEPIALKWVSAGTSGKYVLDFPVALPSSKIKGETAPTFKLVMWGTDQKHNPYDFSASVSFGYGKNEAAKAKAKPEEATNSLWNRFRGSSKPEASRSTVQYLEESMAVRCEGSGQCLELTIPGGMSSAFWKANGYKYNLKEHPECSYTACSRAEFPVSESVVNNVQGYQGVTLVKWGHAK